MIERERQARETDWAPSWVPDELATAGRENLDPVHVARYDNKEDGDAAGETGMLFELGLPETPTVVDLGAGTGQFTLQVAKRAGRVVAVDVSPVMLEHLTAKLKLSGVRNVECVRAGFLTYEHTGPPADLVYSRYALHHLPDFWKAVALTRIAHYLKPGGVLRLSDVVYGFDPANTTASLERWIEENASTSVGDGWTRAELEEHVRDENSTFTWLLEPMILRAGFVIEDAAYSDDQIFAHYICRRNSN
jgi:ubiquinone/menaquinone biosynthesis C-methylase UbiE